MRKRTGTIQPRGKDGMLHARHTITIDGVSVRRWFPLGTDSKALARAKNKALLAQLERGEIPNVAATAALETSSAAFERVVDAMREDGLKSWKDKRQRLRDYAEPVLGHLRIDAVRVGHIREALDSCKTAGKSKQTIVHLRNDLSSVFDWLRREELIEKNPVSLVKVPKFATEDDRPRQILTDEEFVQFLGCAEVSLLLRTMALVSRVFGGMRTSDLHAWRWEHVDTNGWKTAKIRRPKVRGLSLLEMPAPLLPWLQLWWRETGSRTTGPVFPVGRGDRADEARGHTGYARQLRAALETAGITRAELFADGAESRRVDFHSFRRAYVTALADSGVNAQQAMALAAHTKIETHMRYKDRTRALKTPEAIVPDLGQLEVGAQKTKGSEPKDSEPLEAGRTGLEPAASGVTGQQGARFFRFFAPKLVPRSTRFHWVTPTRGRLAWTIPAGTPVEFHHAKS